MKKSKLFRFFAVLAAIALYSGTSAKAQILITNPNLFSGVTVAAATGVNPSGTGINGGSPSELVDGSDVHNNDIFFNGSPAGYVNISGFNPSGTAGAVSSFNFFNGFANDWPGGNRTLGSVEIWYSTTGVTSLDPTTPGYTELTGGPVNIDAQYGLTTGGATQYLPLTNDPIQANYATVTLGSASPSNATSYLFEINGVAGGNAQNFLVPSTNAANGLVLTEIQGIAAAVPEPSTWALMLGSLGLLIFVIRRRASLI